MWTTAGIQIFPVQAPLEPKSARSSDSKVCYPAINVAAFLLVSLLLTGSYGSYPEVGVTLDMGIFCKFTMYMIRCSPFLLLPGK